MEERILKKMEELRLKEEEGAVEREAQRRINAEKMEKLRLKKEEEAVEREAQMRINAEKKKLIEEKQEKLRLKEEEECRPIREAIKLAFCSYYSCQCSEVYPPGQAREYAKRGCMDHFKTNQKILHEMGITTEIINNPKYNKTITRDTRPISPGPLAFRTEFKPTMMSLTHLLTETKPWVEAHPWVMGAYYRNIPATWFEK